VTAYRRGNERAYKPGFKYDSVGFTNATHWADFSTITFALLQELIRPHPVVSRAYLR
jgi:hypothetical protein